MRNLKTRHRWHAWLFAYSPLTGLFLSILLVFLMAIGSGTARAADITTGLVGWWRFNDGNGSTALDSSGYNNTGTISGGTWTKDGPIDGALSLSANAGFVSIGHNAILNPLSALTISAWIYLKGAVKNNNLSLLNKGQWASYRIRLNGTSFQLLQGSLRPDSSALPLNQWVHIAVTVNTQGALYYINGVLDRSDALPYSMATSTSALSIGPLDTDWNIADLRIYNRSLAGSEIWCLYGLGHEGVCSDDNTPPVISRISAVPAHAAAAISWSTDELADERVQYGTTTSYGSEKADSSLSTYHYMSLSGLTAGTTYHFRVKSTDAAGNTAISADHTVVPSAAITASDTTFYVDYANGDDYNDALSPDTAWQHAPGDVHAKGKAGYVLLGPGNTVIFKGGVVYRGSITVPTSGLAGSPLTYDGNSAGTFGTGQAIIDGADLYQPVWTKCVSAAQCGGNPDYGNIYYADAPPGFTSFQQGLFEDGAFMYYSMSPAIPDPFYWDVAQNWYVIPKNSTIITETNSSVTDPTRLPQLTPQVGSYIGLWVRPDFYAIEKITGYDPATSTVFFAELLSPNVPYPHDQYDNYYAIFNQLSLLTEPGQYYLDETRLKLYVWPHGSDNPGNHRYSYTTQQYGISVGNNSYIDIRGFKIQHARNGIYASAYSGINISNVNILNNTVADLFSDQQSAIIDAAANSIIDGNRVENNMRGIGIMVGNVNVTVSNNYLSRNSRVGIWCMQGDHVKIVKNVLTDINGIHDPAIAAYNSCNNVLIASNIITHAASPITYQSGNNLVLYNNFVDSGGANDWGGMTGEIVSMNNTFPKGHLGQGSESAATTYIALNNIIEGNSATIHDYNLYTGLAWNQSARYGWYMGAHETEQTDLSKLFVNPTNGVGSDYSLAQKSPAIAGMDVGGVVPAAFNPSSYINPVTQQNLLRELELKFPEYNFMADLAGVPRPATAPWDIGAYQSSSATSGDVSGDGRVTMFDAALVLKYTVGGPLTAAQQAQADMNRDAKVDAADAMAIARNALGI